MIGGHGTGGSPLGYRIRSPLLIVAGALVAATLAFALIPDLSFAYRSHDAHLILETTSSLIALLTAFILYGRLRENGLWDELVLFTALVLLGLANLARAVAPSFDGSNPRVVWIPLAAQLLAGMAFAAAAFAPPRRLRDPRRRLAYAAGTVAGASLLVALFALAAADLSTGLDPTISPEDTNTLAATGAPGLIAAQLFSMALFGLAAFGYARRARTSSDELLVWLALAATFAAFARLNYALFPSVYSEWVFTGDILRLGIYMALLIGALRQIAVYQAAAPRAAILEERKRIALDLHDGLAQDLAYISMHAERLADDQERARNLAAAARGALIQSRGMIANLRIGEAAVGPAITSLGTALTARYGLALRLDLEDGLEARDEERDELLSIVAEAISNASRHGGATEIGISLSRVGGAGLVLEVSDDGRGFDPSALGGPHSDGTLGIAGMSERAARLGGQLELISSPGAGATVRVSLT